MWPFALPAAEDGARRQNRPMRCPPTLRPFWLHQIDRYAADTIKGGTDRKLNIIDCEGSIHRHVQGLLTFRYGQADPCRKLMHSWRKEIATVEKRRARTKNRQRGSEVT